MSESQQFLSPARKDHHSEKRAVTRAAGIVGVWTMLSRVLGFVRDMFIAKYMGAGLPADAFFVAFRIPNLLRRLFAEGALSAAFIPTFVETLQKNGREEADYLARIALTFSSIVLAAVTILGIILSPWIVRLIAPGFFQDPEKFALTVSLNRIMFPYIFFISLVALASGVLNSMGRFAAPAAAPILLNVSMIASVAIFCTYMNVPPAYALAWSVVVAGVLQLVLQLPFMAIEGTTLRPAFNFRHPSLWSIGRLFVPAAFGGAVYQINVMIGTILASMLEPGSVSWLYYADRVVELPLGVFAVALGTAVLPSMSRQAGNGDVVALNQSLSFSLRLIALFTIPASLALILLREPIVAVLFQRGRFTSLDTHQTAYALLWYTVGLWAFSGLKVVTQAFFSLKDTKTPLKISIVAVVVNLVGGILLMGPMEQGGLALATSLAASINCLVLFFLLIRRLGAFPLSDFVVSLARITVASFIMCVPLFFGRDLGDWSCGFNLRNLTVLMVCISGGLIVFTAAAHLLRCRELRSLLSIIATVRD